jgi:hypothetical protein
MCFEKILNYEIESSERYRRFFSIVLIEYINARKNGLDLAHIISDTLRKSDAFFEYKNKIAVLMAETDKDKSLFAVNRYKNKMHDLFELRFDVVSYPEDGSTIEEILEVVLQSLDRPNPAGRILERKLI